jgi:hypothetical protein
MLEDLFTGDNVGANMTRDEIPSIVDDQTIIFFLHATASERVDEGGADGGGHRRER